MKKFAIILKSVKNKHESLCEMLGTARWPPLRVLMGLHGFQWRAVVLSTLIAQMLSAGGGSTTFWGGLSRGKL